MTLMKFLWQVREGLEGFDQKPRPSLCSQLDSKERVINPTGLILEELGGGRLKPIL